MTARATTQVVAPMSSHSHQSCNRPDSKPRKVEARREAFGRSRGVLEFAVPFLPSDSLEMSIVETGCALRQWRILMNMVKTFVTCPRAPQRFSCHRRHFVPGVLHFSIRSIGTSVRTCSGSGSGVHWRWPGRPLGPCIPSCARGSYPLSYGAKSIG